MNVIETTGPVVLYNPSTKDILDELPGGLTVYPAIDIDVYEGTLDEFLSENTGYTLRGMPIN